MRILLITLLFSIIYMDSQCQSSDKNLVFGTQTISILFFSTASGNQFIKNPMLPDIEILYYKNHLIEQDIKCYGSSSGGPDGIRESSFGYDTSYYFINLATRKWVKYNRFSDTAQPSPALGLEDKKVGWNYDTTTYTSTRYLSGHILRDTIVDEKKYKYFNAITPDENNKGRQQEVTFYLAPQVPGNNDMQAALLNQYKTINEEYHGIVMRVDGKNPETGEAASLRLTIVPNHLTVGQIAMFETWIKKE